MSRAHTQLCFSEGLRVHPPGVCPPHPFLSSAMHYSHPRGANGADVLPSTESFSV